MKGRLVLVNILGILIVAALVIGGVYYYNQNANYIKTDDARVAGDMAQVVSPNAGKVMDWTAKTGSSLSQDNTLGQISDGTHSVSITAPMDGTVVQSSAKDGQLVQPGQVLAQVVDMKKLYISANIDETAVKDIEVGASVDVTIDEDSSTTLKGKVEEIGHATNSVFSLLPQQNTSGNYTKVTQKIPVKISIGNYSEEVVPGMNATVKISKK
ncbi:HlyD family efflux transporter periplasmic adaptor subunit [Ectobacillus panaciterrae]|uniref:HlyD family efflux transporter periplasmic adaptor subunit n=1 Tax=Ectobacillus panaciterrae TaxID=363872 RepID=UPI00042A74BF|nr:HlyD family efflux transporter periplasmic adaptor subunit [Ectobacillus panaciterrae]